MTSPHGILVGGTSILGWSIVRALRRAEAIDHWRITCNRFSRHTAAKSWLRINADEPNAWDPIFEMGAPTLVYCGGICNVDRCEAHPDFARSINVEGLRRLVDGLSPKTRLVYCSSDHVFGLGRHVAYVESSTPEPISAYGRMRVEAEGYVLAQRPDALVVRVGLPLGPSIDGRRGHLDWLRYRHAKDLPMNVIEGETRTAVQADALADRILALARSSLAGIRHAAGEPIDRPRLAQELCGELGLTPRFAVTRRDELDKPHLGHIALATEYDDALATPLPRR